jgi:hypothetical protein
VHAWEASGLLSDGQADAILDSYRVRRRRFSLRGVALPLGGVLVGVGLAVLVSVLLDRPLEPWLLGVWGGALLLGAYLRRTPGLLLMGIGAATAWWLGQVVGNDPGSLTLVVALGVAATTCLATAAVHETRLVRLGEPWREVGAALALVMLLVAALPSSTAEGAAWNSWLVGGPLFASVAVIAALAAIEGSVRIEPLVVVAASVTSVLLVVWEEGAAGSGPTTTADWAHLGACVTAYVGLATAVAVLGVVRDSWRLTALATAGVVAFAVTQATAALGRVVDAPWALALAGVVGLATGYLFRRAVRPLATAPERQP